MSQREKFIHEVLRMNDRFVQEVIEGFNFCPYAKGTRVTGRSTREVLLQRTFEHLPTVDLLEQMHKREKSPEVIQVIYPRLGGDLRQFEQLHRHARDALRERLGSSTGYVQACFHPDYPCNTRNPETLVMFLRKSPDPMIQFVLNDVIESVRGDVYTGTIVVNPEDVANFDLMRPRPLSTAQRIARDNHARVMTEGTEKIAALIDEIHRERAAAYAPFEDVDV